jgi:hypothetical protein
LDDRLAALVKPGWAMSMRTDWAAAFRNRAVHTEGLELRRHGGSDELRVGIGNAVAASGQASDQGCQHDATVNVAERAQLIPQLVLTSRN